MAHTTSGAPTMLCQSCGNPVAGPGAFCTRCGLQAPFVTATGQPIPPPPGYLHPSRVFRHIQALGILWFLYGIYRAAAGLFATFILAGIAPRFGFGPWTMPGEFWRFGHGRFWAPIMAVITVYTAISALLSFLVGYGLTTRAPWARILAIIAAILALIRIPFGTALGIYTLWALAPATSALEYDAIADRT